MWYLTEVADWWDKQRNQSEKALENFVTKHPNQFGIITATAVHTSMTLGSGFVDLLRLGDGIAKGGIDGWARDGLRLLGIAGPAGKGFQMLKSAKNTKIASLIIDIGGPRCSWITSTKALIQTGKKVDGQLFASVDDLAQAVGIPLNQTAGISLQAMANNLRSIGANVSHVRQVSSLKEIIKMLPRDGSVVMVSVKGLRAGNQVGGHAVYVFYNTLGRLKIMDRSGIFNTFEDLARRYPQVDEFVPRAASTITNVYGKFVGPGGAAVLVMSVLGVSAEKK